MENLLAFHSELTPYHLEEWWRVSQGKLVVGSTWWWAGYFCWRTANYKIISLFSSDFRRKKNNWKKCVLHFFLYDSLWSCSVVTVLLLFILGCKAAVGTEEIIIEFPGMTNDCHGMQWWNYHHILLQLVKEGAAAVQPCCNSCRHHSKLLAECLFCLCSLVTNKWEILKASLNNKWNDDDTSHKMGYDVWNLRLWSWLLCCFTTMWWNEWVVNLDCWIA